MTTVGYGDIAPQTVAGQALAAALMFLGYAIIAVPTGNRFGGTGRPGSPQGQQPGLSVLLGRGARSRCLALQVLRGEALGVCPTETQRGIAASAAKQEQPRA